MVQYLDLSLAEHKRDRFDWLLINLTFKMTKTFAFEQ